MLRFFSRPSAGLLAATATFVVVGATLVATPASATPSGDPAEEATIRSAMQAAGLDSSRQDAFIDKLRTGDHLDSMSTDSLPVDRREEQTPAGGSRVVETFADGSQRSTATIPATIVDSDTGDPIETLTTYECNALHCTILLSRAQTKQLATGSAGAAAIVTAMCGIAAWACAIAVGLMIDQANRAVSQGRCAGLRKFNSVSLVTWPVVESCRQ